MKVHCPIQNCKWEKDLIIDGLDTEQIYKKAKSEISQHRRTSKACDRHYCACREHYASSRGLSNHFKKFSDSNVHFELSYCSVISNNNHIVLNVEPLESDRKISEYSALWHTKGIVYGSTIGANCYDPPPHAIPELLRAGTNIIQTIDNSKPPAKRPKRVIHPRFGTATRALDDESMEIDTYDDLSAENFTETHINEDLENDSEPSNTVYSSISELLSITAANPSTEPISLPPEVHTRLPGISNLPPSIRISSNSDQPTHGCRRSARLANIEPTIDIVTEPLNDPAPLDYNFFQS
jgi:hypothetical protein